MKTVICIIAATLTFAGLSCVDRDIDEPLTDSVSSAVLVDSDGLYTVSVTYDPDKITLQQATLMLDSVQVLHQDATVEAVNDWQSPLEGYVLPAQNPHWEEDNHHVEISVATSGIDVDTSTWDFVDPSVIMDILCPPGH